jgi:tetratricopeptide (TPR) repeat protein
MRLNLLAWEFLGSVVVVIVMTALAIATRHRWPALGAAWSAYVVTVLPVSGVLHNGPQLAADRYTYLACLPWALLLGALVARGAPDWHAGPDARRRAVALGGALVGVLGGLGVLTWNQTQIWRDTEALWSHTVSVAPSARALASLADLRLANGDVADAIKLAQRAVDLEPDRVDARNVLGLALAQRGELDLALQEFRRAVQLAPNDSVSRNNLGVTLARQEQWDRALAEFREAVRLSPAYGAANRNLGATLDHLGRHEEARAYLERAEQLRTRLSPR